MRRTAITLAVLTLLVTGAVVAFLRAAGIWDQHRSLPQAASDLWFVIDVALTEKRGYPAPPLTRRAYASAFERLSCHADRGVNHFAKTRMLAWGEAVAPLLMDALEDQRPMAWKYHPGIAESLGAIGHEAAASKLVRKLYDDSVRDIGRDAILDAIGEIGVREVVPDLLAWYEFDERRRAERYAGRARIPGIPTRFYVNLGKLGAHPFLIEQLPLVDSPERDGRGYTVAILRGLAHAKDPAALPILDRYLSHTDSGIQQYAAKAIDRIEVSLGIDAALASFPTGNVFEQQRLIEAYFSDAQAAEDPRVVPLLESLLATPTLRDEAGVALARLDTPSAVRALEPTLLWPEPRELVAALGRYGRIHGYALLEPFLDHPDPEVQQTTVEALLPVPSRRVDGWLERKSRDGKGGVAQQAARARFLRDKYELYYAMHDLVQRDGESDRVAAQEWLYAWISKSLRLPMSLSHPFAALHYVALVFALIFGFFLVFNLARAFELYRFHTTLHFLIAICLLGAFLVVDYDEGFYRYNIGITLFLLLGYLFMERGSNEPGRAGSRFGRMAGASLWLVVPSLLYFGTPILAESMHRAFSNGLYFSLFCAYSLVCSILLLEEYLLPRHIIPRSTRSTRWMATVLSTVLLSFVGVAVFEYASGLSGSGVSSGPLALWMLAPVVVLVLWQWRQLFAVHPRSVDPPPMPDPSLEVVRDREMISVHRRDTRSRVVRVYRAVLAASAGKTFLQGTRASVGVLFAGMAAAAGLAIPLCALALPLYALITMNWGRAPLWQFAALHFLSTALVFGLLLTNSRRSRLVLQLRNGHVRSGHPTLGAVFVGGYWRRRPPCDVELSHAARQWLAQMLRVA